MGHHGEVGSRPLEFSGVQSDHQMIVIVWILDWVTFVMIIMEMIMMNLIVRMAPEKMDLRERTITENRGVHGDEQAHHRQKNRS